MRQVRAVNSSRKLWQQPRFWLFRSDGDAVARHRLRRLWSDDAVMAMGSGHFNCRLFPVRIVGHAAGTTVWEALR